MRLGARGAATKDTDVVPEACWTSRDRPSAAARLPKQPRKVLTEGSNAKGSALSLPEVPIPMPRHNRRDDSVARTLLHRSARQHDAGAIGSRRLYIGGLIRTAAPLPAASGRVPDRRAAPPPPAHLARPVSLVGRTAPREDRNGTDARGGTGGRGRGGGEEREEGPHTHTPHESTPQHKTHKSIYTWILLCVQENHKTMLLPSRLIL